VPGYRGLVPGYRGVVLLSFIVGQPNHFQGAGLSRVPGYRGAGLSRFDCILKSNFFEAKNLDFAHNFFLSRKSVEIKNIFGKESTILKRYVSTESQMKSKLVAFFAVTKNTMKN